MQSQKETKGSKNIQGIIFFPTFATNKQLNEEILYKYRNHKQCNSDIKFYH